MKPKSSYQAVLYSTSAVFTCVTCFGESVHIVYLISIKSAKILG